MAPAPMRQPAPIVTSPHTVAPGATWTSSSSRQSWSTLAFVLTMQPRPRREPGHHDGAVEDRGGVAELDAVVDRRGGRDDGGEAPAGLQPGVEQTSAAVVHAHLAEPEDRDEVAALGAVSSHASSVTEVGDVHPRTLHAWAPRSRRRGGPAAAARRRAPLRGRRRRPAPRQPWRKRSVTRSSWSVAQVGAARQVERLGVLDERVLDPVMVAVEVRGLEVVGVPDRARLHPGLVEVAHQRLAIAPVALGVDAERHHPVVVVGVRGRIGNVEPLDLGRLRLIVAIDAPLGVQEGGHRLELGDAEGGLQVGEPEVVADLAVDVADLVVLRLGGEVAGLARVAPGRR